MPRILHILTRVEDPLAKEIISLQTQKSDVTIDLIDLTIADPNYQQLLEKMFEADSVQVW